MYVIYPCLYAGACGYWHFRHQWWERFLFLLCCHFLTMNKWCLQWITWVSQQVFSGDSVLSGFHFFNQHGRFQCFDVFGRNGCPGVTWWHYSRRVLLGWCRGVTPCGVDDTLCLHCQHMLWLVCVSAVSSVVPKGLRRGEQTYVIVLRDVCSNGWPSGVRPAC